MKKDIIFLTLAEILDIHHDQIERYGGSLGVRDMNMLQSAIAQPQASFQGQWLHDDLFLMAAAYAFHICENHSFIDGNKRVALTSALIFFELNGVSVVDPEDSLIDVMLSVAQGRTKKSILADIFRHLTNFSG